MTKWLTVQKIYSIMFSILCANDDHGITTYEVDRII